MSRTKSLVTALAILAAACLVGAWYRSAQNNAVLAADEKEKPKDKGKDKDKAETDEAAIRKTADEFARAFAKGDAKAVAALWATDGEFTDADGETIRGRKEIEKAYAEFFEKNPKAAIEMQVESVKFLGKHVALEEGTVKVTLAGEKTPGVSRYSVLHVREDDAWKMGSVREWVPDPAQLVSLKDVEWLVGEWSAKSGDATANVSYAWDDEKSSIRGKYVLKRGDKVIASGTQIIRKDPSGGLRSWQFDNNGSNAEWEWTREDGNWVIESQGILPDGSEVTAVNLLVPVGKDGFTWQSVERTAAGTELPDTPPVKVTRVKDKSKN
jgi:uncharacterized protein (TIGR02246 family)